MIMLIIYNEFILYLFLILIVDPLTLTIVLSLFNLFIIITSQSSLQYQYHFIICNLYGSPPYGRPRSCRVIYYFDTPALGIRHQSFDRVSLQRGMWVFQASRACQLHRQVSTTRLADWP
jgi:hypothetical protein